MFGVARADEAAKTAGEGVRPIAAYKLYVAEELKTLVATTRILVTKVKDGDLAGARDAYGSVPLHDGRIAPVAVRFNDRDGSEDDVEGKAGDLPTLCGKLGVE